VAALHLLAAEGIKHPGIWNPIVIGVLTVLCAVGLFCGSVYLLLGTNLGGRLGFLVAAAGLTGFMVLLTTLWWTSGNSGLDPPHGDSPSWSVVEVLKPGELPKASKTTAVDAIEDRGKPIKGDALTNLKPALDGALVTVQPVAGGEAPSQPLAQFASSTDYLVEGLRAYEIGGGTKNVFWHQPKYAAVELCPTKPDVTPPVCDPLQDTQFAILKFDLGSLRQPVVAYWFMSIVLFSLSLLGLHWWEQDDRKRKRAALAPVPAPSSN